MKTLWLIIFGLVAAADVAMGSAAGLAIAVDPLLIFITETK